ncbi:unnamed protein product, partial [Brassica rapa subsp. trilocularis]
MIPFWIKIQGVPIHLWKEGTARSIAEGIGTFEVTDIIAESMRMRVHVNGRLPLIKSSVLEFDNGDELTATLVYERLEKYCSQCDCLDNELKDCLEAKTLKKAMLASQENGQGDKMLTAPRVDRSFCERMSNVRATGDTDSWRGDSKRPNERNQPHFTFQASSPTTNHCMGREGTHRERSGSQKNNFQRDSSFDRRDPSSRREGYKDWKPRGSSHGDSQGVSPRDGRVSPRREASRSKELPLPPDRRSPLRRSPDRLSPAAVEAAAEDIRDVMITYTSCTDPSESAARKERLRQAAALGHLEKSAIRAEGVRAARKETEEHPTDTEERASQERVPISTRLASRLGPIANLESTLEAATVQSPEVVKKRKPARLPGRRTMASSPSQVPGSSPRKRKAQQTKPPLSCKKPTTGAGGAQKPPKARTVRGGTN